MIRFRAVTYNIHKGIGGIDRRYRIERIIEVLNWYKPDIAFLQEVDHGVPRSNRDRQVDVLGEALGFKHRAFQANVQLRHGCYGNAILSRFPLSEVHDIDLSVRFKKSRRALIAVCTIGEEKKHNVVVLNCHLGLAAYERRKQVESLLRHLAEFNPGSSQSHIVAGDFNDTWNHLGKELMLPAGYAANQSRAPTFPAMFPVRRLDHMYFSGAASSPHSFAGHTAVARQASDHLPVIADVEIQS